MTLRLQRRFVLMLALCALPAWLSAQPAPQPAPAPLAQPSAPAQPLPQDQLDALLAPIALYPDQLLSQILIAATYPLDVVEAARFVQQNPGLQGDALNRSVESKPWDPSVLSLTAFPQVLAMMNDKLDWTQQLGDAFLANEAQVMQTVQSLRARAQSAGNLQSTEQQRVYTQDQSIIIEPAQPQVVFVPVYNPAVIYGPWWVPAYRPWFWYPPPIYGYPPFGAAIGVGFFWGTAWAISANHWGWCNPNWRGGSININVNNNYFMNRPQYNNRYQNGNWQHNADQRRGVAYRDSSVQNRYRPNNPGAQTREAYRGRDASGPTTGQANTAVQRPGGQPGAGAGQRPTTMDRPGSAGVGSTMTRPGGVSSGAPIDRGSTAMTRPAGSVSSGSGSMTRQTPTYNASQSRPQAQQYSNRGAQSRATMNAPTQRSSGGGGAGAARGGGGGGAARGGGGGGSGGGGGGRR